MILYCRALCSIAGGVEAPGVSWTNFSDWVYTMVSSAQVDLPSAAVVNIGRCYKEHLFHLLEETRRQAGGHTLLVITDPYKVEIFTNTRRQWSPFWRGHRSNCPSSRCLKCQAPVTTRES
ncbi:hypothetical protein RRG08_001102 [Elysia crispata]|uniref:Uncharacterized protein n=1 Tax=Elysia crispata TaxID=231223 RepID=A0AAE1E5G6_9GAST|nr:hypothetical protein RRG08_001102 [Elysia crispata]